MTKLQIISLISLVTLVGPQTAGTAPAILKSEFIFERSPLPFAHASTIVETAGGLVASWVGGPRERAPEVVIWTSRHDGAGWTVPVEAANGLQPDGTRLPCWNPVLFQPTDGPLLLFYKVGANPSELAGARPHVLGWGADVVAANSPAGRDCRPGAREAYRASARNIARGFQHRRRRVGCSHGTVFRRLDHCVARVEHGVAEDRPAQ